MNEYRIVNANIDEQALGKKISLKKYQSVKVLRKFKVENRYYFVIVKLDGYDKFKTYLISEKTLKKFSNQDLSNRSEHLFEKELIRQSKTAIVQIPEKTKQKISWSYTKNYVLTIDLCQSKNAWDLNLFESLVKLSAELKKPIPVSLSITGLWAYHYYDEFKKLIAWEQEKKLDIIWVNHSFHHQLSPNENGKLLFLTKPGLDFENEIIQLEKFLLEQGELFSVFFRFPGLTDNEELRNKLVNFSLFNLGSNAWLSKGEKIKNNSIILLHGNGNDPIGTKIFLRQLGIREISFLNELEAFVSSMQIIR